ncbi:aspartyl aminopeptidase [Rhizophagus clarus]|uniref:aspartyl aminopeptidase n=1 Tax=Rhizophagus clarus TaxID=94130 RepID=A0A8H3MF36_9GLOM|nr:aspartyl aminopeptidase [Rhizophagus clarus]
MDINSTPPDVASDFIKFVNNSPSPFHAVEEARTRLVAAGYEELKERDNWKDILKNNGKYYFTRNRSTIVAFAIGGEYKPGNGFSMAGAHTDSPCLKVKPISKKEKDGYLQVGVEPYGGGLWHTWFDRDLSVAGRVMVETKKNKFEHRLVRITRPILRIPTLAIHLDRDVREGFKFNNETHLTPLIATASKALAGNKENNEEKNVKHHPALLNVLIQELGCNVNEIHDFELCLYDTQPSTIGGAYNEFIFSPRLDNLMMTYTVLTGLINSTKNTSESLCNDPNIRLITLFDNEEIGSTTAHGANSSLLETTLRRICNANAKTGYETIFEEAIHKSFMISADMAHAVHPNYCERYEENHRPKMNQGIVIKTNANQRYATTSATSLILRQAAKKYEVPLQEFVVRSDLPCGSTIGPMISSNLGLRTVDIGNPQLSMHSIRETAGTDDVDHAIKLFQGYFEDFAKIDENITVD